MNELIPRAMRAKPTCTRSMISTMLNTLRVPTLSLNMSIIYVYTIHVLSNLSL